MADQLSAVHARLKKLREEKNLKIRPTPHLKTTFTDFSGQERPLVIRYYQVQGILHLCAMRRFLLGDDTGLGKSLMAIAALCYIWEKEPDGKVVVLTTKSSVEQWSSEFSKFTTGVKVVVCKGTPTQREAARKLYKDSKGPTVLVMGYRAAVQDFSQIQDWKDHILITDEATAYKNPKTQVHQTCKFLAGASSRCWALTATMIKNNLMEGFGIYQIVVPGIFQTKDKGVGKAMSFNQFMLYFCITRMQKIPRSNRQIPVIVGYSADKVREFRQIIDPYFIGRPKHEVATELPAVIMQDLKVTLTDRQEEKYAEALAGLLELKDETKVTTELTAIAYCQEIVDHLGLLGMDGDSPKLEALTDILTEGALEGDKVIVFSRFRKMVDIIVPHLIKHGVKTVRVTGNENESQRQEAMKAFQNPDSDVRVICVTAAGAESINLQAAKALICFDTPWSAGDFLQLIGRMVRIGSVHDRCYVIHLVAQGKKKKDTVDRRVLDVLSKKMDLVEMVLGKRIKGVGDQLAISVENEISDLFSSLKQDAREK